MDDNQRPWQLRDLGPRTMVVPRQGDLLFGNRLSWIQMIFNVSADQWTHAAVVVEVGDEVRTIEIGESGCFSRPVAEFFDVYRQVGLARPAMEPACQERVATTAQLHLEVCDITYSWPYCTLVGVSAVLRRLLPERAATRLVGLSERLAAFLEARRPRSDATCSSFVAAVVDAACDDCRLRFHWPARSRTPPWRARPSVTDVMPGPAPTVPDEVRTPPGRAGTCSPRPTCGWPTATRSGPCSRTTAPSCSVIWSPISALFSALFSAPNLREEVT